MLGLHLFFQRTLIGTAWRAAAADSDTAELMGISFDKIVTLTFGISSALAGGAGVLIAPLFLVGQDLWLQGPKAFAAAALGQFQVIGTMLGGPVLGVMEAIAAGYVSSSYKSAIAYGMTIVVLMTIAIPRMPPGGGAPPRHARTTTLEAIGVAPHSERSVRMACAWVLLAGRSCCHFSSTTIRRTSLTLAPIYGVAALGLQLVIGFGGAIIVGFAAFLGIGAYNIGRRGDEFALRISGSAASGCLAGGADRVDLRTDASAADALLRHRDWLRRICHLVFVNRRPSPTACREFPASPSPGSPDTRSRPTISSISWHRRSWCWSMSRCAGWWARVTVAR